MLYPPLLAGEGRIAQALAQKSSPRVDRLLQPGLRGGCLPLPGAQLVGVLEREADIVEAFQEPHAVGGRDVEPDVAAARAADGLRFEIDRERGRAVRDQ